MIVDPEWNGDMCILRWHDGENRFRADSIARWHAVLDDLESHDGPLALVVIGDGRFFSNGLDLDWMGRHPDETAPMVEAVHRLLGRMLVFPAYTVAAVNGHAFAGGAMLAAAFDRRVMRSDRGYWCLPEVDLGFPLTDAMFAAVASHMPTASLADAMVTGRRYTAADARAAGIVEHVAPEREVEGLALELAEPMAAKNRDVIAAHKRMLFGDAAARCGWTPDG
jgi:Delta3-Delta2-enoyl-CoA isomerase